MVTHLPNLQYLTGFSGTAGAAVITGSRCVLVIDFRYETAARALVSAFETELYRIPAWIEPTTYAVAMLVASRR